MNGATSKVLAPQAQTHPTTSGGCSSYVRCNGKSLCLKIHREGIFPFFIAHLFLTCSIQKFLANGFFVCLSKCCFLWFEPIAVLNNSVEICVEARHHERNISARRRTDLRWRQQLIFFRLESRIGKEVTRIDNPNDPCLRLFHADSIINGICFSVCS